MSAPIANTPTSPSTADQHDGYPSLARWIARDPDNETFIFRKFKKLSALNLLHLQSQVIGLEDKLNNLDEEIRKDTNNMEVRQCLRRWESFVQLQTTANPTITERMKIVNDIQDKLKEYHEALLRQAQIAGLSHPRKGALGAFRNFFSGHKDIEGKMLSGQAKHMLDDEEDLLSLKPPGDRALLAQFLRNHWPAPTKATDQGPEQYAYFLEDRVQQVVVVINVFVAAILLVGAIVSLYYTRTPPVRLTLVAVFTSLFAISLVLFTSSNRSEVFAGTAAYAAVLVVFVSGDFGNN